MRVAIIGCGRIGRVHAAAVAKQPGVERLVLCDPELNGLDWAAAECGGSAWHGDVDGLLAEVQPDVVHVCTPPTTHAGIAVRALQAGASVLVEKPMALTSAESLRIAAALRGRPDALCVDHNYLFEPEMLTARRWIAEGRIGRVFATHVFYGVDVGAGGPPAGGWAQALPGGRFTDLLPHPLYLTSHLLGAVRSISARTASAQPREGATELGVLLGCERGLGTVQVSLASVPWELSLTIRGTAGTIRVDFARQHATIVRPRRGPRALAQARMALDAGRQAAVGGVRRVAGKLSGRLRGYPGLRALVARFYAGLRDGLPPPVGFADGAAMVSALERVRLHVEARVTEGARDEAARVWRRHA